MIAIETARPIGEAESVWPDTFLPEDADLVRIVLNWTRLPDHIRAAIVSLERSAAVESASGVG